jgi:hypothetical protein
MARRAHEHPQKGCYFGKSSGKTRNRTLGIAEIVLTNLDAPRAENDLSDERPRRREFAFSVTLRSMPCAKTYRDLDDGCADGPEWRTWLGATGRRAGDCADRERASRLPPGGLTVSRP